MGDRVFGMLLIAFGALHGIRLGNYLVGTVRMVRARRKFLPVRVLGGLTDVRVKVVEAPAGDAPLVVRQAWVGLILPLAAGETGPRMARSGRLLADSRGWPGAMRRFLLGAYRVGYVVEAHIALEMLSSWAPEAHAWWRPNMPSHFDPGRRFVFALESCRSLNDAL
jgi:hypothetical protein